MLERRVAGTVPRKHHVALRGKDGELLVEECVTRAGFDGPYTILYHQHRPHTHRPEPAIHGWKAPQALPPRPLAKRHYLTPRLDARGGPPVDARQVLLFNAQVAVGALTPTAADPVYVVNADADDLFFVLEGGGVLRTPQGDLRFAALDYVGIPRGTLHRFLPDAGVAQRWLSLECTGPVGPLEQFRNEAGQLRMDAPYSHRDFRVPELQAPRDEGLRSVVVKRGGVWHGFALETSPLDVVGWDGALYPWAFPILAFQPRVSSVHLPPTWHGTFATRGALICSFVPRPVDFDPEAIPCPYPHSSVDVDEVLFYCKGEFTSRRGVGPGSISHHPAGIPHGPHPGAYEGSLGSKATGELAVMLDCYEPLQATAAAASVEDAGYMESFLAPAGR
jgi:homogentisate 1,2-dioxygenase